MFEHDLYSIPDLALPNDRYHGNNAKKMLVVADIEDAGTHHELLSKILRAINHDIAEDVHALHVQNGEAIALAGSDAAENYDHIILFGVNPVSMGFNISLTKRVVRLERLTIIRSAPLSRVASDTEEKRKLWQVLKTLFK